MKEREWGFLGNSRGVRWRKEDQRGLRFNRFVTSHYISAELVQLQESAPAFLVGSE